LLTPQLQSKKNKRMKIIEKYKQLGPLNFIKRVMLSLLSVVGIRINKWLICTQKLNTNKLQSHNIDGKFIVRQMTLKDFLTSKKFDEDKLKSFKERFSNKFFVAYGVYDKNELAYYCWISLKEYQFSKDLYKSTLNEDQGMLFDAFCFPKYRGNRLHNFMNIYRLKKLEEHKKKEALVVLLSQNTPARKSQKKAGFVCLKTVTTYVIFGKKGYFVSNKKINL